MTRTGNDAVAWARNHMRWPQGYCLQYVRTCFDVGSKYYDATTAWENARYKHRTENGGACPRAVPIWWTGGSSGHGHVALSIGGGMCISTDAAGPGKNARININELTRRWGLNFQGWTEDINGVRVYDSKAGKPAAGWERVRLTALGPGKRNKDVEVVERRLLAKGFHKPGEPINVDGLWGNRVTDAYREWQKRLGFTGSDANGMPGHYSLRKLGLEVV